MKFVTPSYEILDPCDGQEMLERIERIGRTCYKSLDRIAEGSAERFCLMLLKRGHTSVFDHVSITVRFIVDRGVTHEMVRHRICAFSQESTRFCDYSGCGIELIHPPGLTDAQRERREKHFWDTQHIYDAERNEGVLPEIARGVLPTCLKTELVWTCDITEWRYVLNLRALGAKGRPHPQMLEVTVPLLKELQSRIPVLFSDLILEIPSNA
jgi:thymidylate synthase (FAD)